MKLCKYHKQAFKWVIEYTYHSAYNDGKSGVQSTEKSKEKEIRDITTVQRMAFEMHMPTKGKCTCNPKKILKLDTQELTKHYD